MWEPCKKLKNLVLPDQQTLVREGKIKFEIGNFSKKNIEMNKGDDIGKIARVQKA